MSDDDELRTIANRDVPEEALRFFARWWQLETYLREIVYVELRAKYGVNYTTHLDRRAVKRANADKKNVYMASADDEDLLAYVDVGGLLEIIDQHWDVFSAALMPRDRWKASAELLRELRNRVSHCRRPHKDDLGRLLQLLRDLEHGAQRFYGSYNGTGCNISPRDPFAKAWIKGKHPDAARLLKRADLKYETTTRVWLSRRPWAPDPAGAAVSGKPGYLWHVQWSIGARQLRPKELWAQVRKRSLVDAQIVHLLFWYPSLITATFASIDDTTANADAVGQLFDELLMRSRQPPPNPNEEYDAEGSLWRDDAVQLPRKGASRHYLGGVRPLPPRPSLQCGVTTSARTHITAPLGQRARYSWPAVPLPNLVPIEAQLGRPSTPSGSGAMRP